MYLKSLIPKNNWENLSFPLSNKVWSEKLFSDIFNQFKSKVENLFTEENHMYILFKIRYDTNEIVTIGSLQRINKNDLSWYSEWVINNLLIKSEEYKDTGILELIFSYGFKDEIISDKPKLKIDLKFQNINNLKIPVSSNPLDFGILISKIENNFFLSNDGNIFKIKKFENFNELEMFDDKGKSVLKWEDKFISDNKFERLINGTSFIYEDNTQIFSSKAIKTKFINTLKEGDLFGTQFLTMDIETFLDKDNIMIPCTISFYDGLKVWSFYLSDFDSIDNFVLTALKSIFKRKYRNYSVYIHNMARFDAIFLLKYLIQLGTLKPLIREGRIISLTLKSERNILTFKDSYQILLTSLNNLSKAFSIDSPKTVFPYLFVNENNLEYLGNVPELKYFDEKINENQYSEYKSNFNNNWNLKNESIKYCENDCIALYQVIVKFSEIIFEQFGIIIHKYSTLPSLAFAIFRTKFMKFESIPSLSGKISKDIRQGYTGGAVDMYIPEGVNIKSYDVNSLYPSRMRDCLLPTGNIKKFEGNIFEIETNPFGFFFCKIEAPNNIEHPILQTHIKTKSGVRTISPIGTWTDIIFSEELKNALKYGYKFEVLWGYTFDSDFLFEEYVNYLFALRQQYPKSDPLNFIAKILLNSLYGRFGMRDDLPDILIMNKKDFLKFEEDNLNIILDSKELGNHFLIEIIKESDSEENYLNTNVAVAAAITAYSRIHMSKFKNNPNINLYYTDTDSIFTDSVIDESFIESRTLGLLKLENIIEKAVFLNAKLYCLLTEGGKLITKVKGLKDVSDLTLHDFENLLYKNAFISKSNVKWTKNLAEGHIKLIKHMYTIQTNDNKRKLIYNKNGKLIGTKAYRINENKDFII